MTGSFWVLVLGTCLLVPGRTVACRSHALGWVSSRVSKEFLYLVLP